MLSVKNIILLSCALFGAAIAEAPAAASGPVAVEAKGEKRCRPFFPGDINRNMRPCSRPVPCPFENRNQRRNPHCPTLKPCGGKPRHSCTTSWSCSSSTESCSSSWSETSSTDCRPCRQTSSSSCRKTSSTSCRKTSSTSCRKTSSSFCPTTSSTTECPTTSSSTTECPRARHERHERHERPHDNHVVGPVQLDVNGGWYKFRFGPTGSTVVKTYNFITVGPSVLRVTGLDCSGDAFSVYDNGNLILQTPLIGGDNCHHADQRVSAHRAYKSNDYSHGRVNLAPGAHSIKIVVARSPNKHGEAALRVDAVMSHCPRELNGLKVVNTPVPFHKAAGVCKALGMKLADIDIYNFLDATTIAFECAGAFSASWIGSYWKDDYKRQGLALYTGSSAPGGSINVPACSEEHLPVICQVRNKDECHREEDETSSCDCSYANYDHVCCECSECPSSSESTCEPTSSTSRCSETSSTSSHRHRGRRHRRN